MGRHASRSTSGNPDLLWGSKALVGSKPTRRFVRKILGSGGVEVTRRLDQSLGKSAEIRIAVPMLNEKKKQVQILPATLIIYLNLHFYR